MQSCILIPSCPQRQQVWEIYTNASIPLMGIKNHQVYMKLLRGEVITHVKPNICPDHVWDITEQCFREEPAARASYVSVERYRQ